MTDSEEEEEEPVNKTTPPGEFSCATLKQDSKSGICGNYSLYKFSLYVSIKVSIQLIDSKS